MLPLPLHLSLPTAPSHSLPLHAGPATLPLPFKLNPISFLSKKSPLFHNIIGKGGDLIGARVATAPSSPPLKKLVFTLPTSPRTSSSDFPPLHASSFRRMIRRAALSLQPSWKSDQDALTRSVVRPRKRRGGLKFQMRGQLYSSGWTGAGGRQGGRDHHGRRRSFCILQRTKIEARYFLLPPFLTPSLVPLRRNWPRLPARRRLLRSSDRGNERPSERARASERGTLRPFFPPTPPFLCRARQSVVPSNSIWQNSTRQ